jgi:hypothetical protein
MVEKNRVVVSAALNSQLSTINSFGRQADISWLHLSRKQDRHRRGRSVTDAFRQPSPLTDANGEGCRVEAKRRRAKTRSKRGFGSASPSI